MAGQSTSDDDWLIDQNIDLDFYAFSERVGLILEDNALNPTPKQLQAARTQALMELLK